MTLCCPPLVCRQDMEQQLGSLILATDISRQNEFLSTFREHLDNQSLDLQQAPHRHFILQVTNHRAVYIYIYIHIYIYIYIYIYIIYIYTYTHRY